MAGGSLSEGRLWNLNPYSNTCSAGQRLVRLWCCGAGLRRDAHITFRIESDSKIVSVTPISAVFSKWAHSLEFDKIIAIILSRFSETPSLPRCWCFLRPFLIPWFLWFYRGIPPYFYSLICLTFPDTEQRTASRKLAWPSSRVFGQVADCDQHLRRMG